MPYNPGLGQRHGKKRHLHAHSPVNFKELKCYRNSNSKIHGIVNTLPKLKLQPAKVFGGTPAHLIFSRPMVNGGYMFDRIEVVKREYVS